MCRIAICPSLVGTVYLYPLLIYVIGVLGIDVFPTNSNELLRCTDIEPSVCPQSDLFPQHFSCLF